MHNRWGVLTILFIVRLTMAFQFQSVAAVAPLLGHDFGVGLADIGVLIGLYFMPGVVLSLPGGAIGQRLGDRHTTLGALALMLIGSLMMALTASWSWQVAGRLTAGAGGVLLNVQLTKMITDWFAGHEIATAMAVFVNSWPAGVALSLLTLPWIGTAYGVNAVYLVVAALLALGLALAATYRPPAAHAAVAAASGQLDLQAMAAVTVAGLMWGLLNVGFATIFSFGPTMLVERGWSIASAGSTISLVLWLVVLSVPLGGFVADRLKRPQAVLVGGSLLFAVLMLVFAHTGAVLPSVIALGLISGQPAGPMMSLPARVLQPATRAVGMGLFYTLYYAAMMLGPVIGGAYGSTTAAFDFGAIALALCPLLLVLFNAIARRRVA
ncbi:MFS transporter [Bradyrhizobium sp. NP1]|uniref:MFS transporter n=1 Tax=Bradyrhizobium sp. NP1 TaxID=3049772 RepID=UPI0025A5DFA8|nr:MFS transporter [Bradyrhizobium sp. NP1]WJR75979.1 MFS transporter [Bradyrhizobium sp. NP1]